MSRRQVLLFGILLLVAGAAVWLWRTSSAEPLAAFRTFPYTYISESAAGYDETAVILDRGSIDGPPSIEVAASGATAWPAFVDPSGKLIPTKDGKPYIFPLIPNGNTSRTPVIKPLGRPLTGSEIDGMVRYQTTEGAKRMEAFRTEMMR